MACYSPIAAWRSHTKNPETGKYGIVFSPPKHARKEPESLSLPCGKCIGCLADQSLMWSIRAYHESTLHDHSSFLTLTYDDEHLPGDGKISKPDLQNFFKRMRHNYKFRYLACGEYGEKTRRPHYHALIFGENFNAYGDRVDINDQMYTSHKVSKIWGLGNVSIAECNLQTIMYTCGYVHKKVGDDDCFRLMSRRPGIGKDWLEKYRTDLTNTGGNPMVTIEGREFPIPPRYLDWKDEEFKEVKEKRKEFAQTKAKSYGALSVRSKEKNHRAKLNQRKLGDV